MRLTLLRADAETVGDFSRAEPLGPQLADLSELRLRRWISTLVTCRPLWPFAMPSRCRSSISSRSNAASAPIDVSGNAIPSNLASKPRQVP